MYFYNNKEFENYIKIFSNSKDFIVTLIKEEISVSNQKIKSVVEFLLYNKDVLDKLTIDEVIKQNPENIRENIAKALGKKFIKDLVLRSVVFTFKYAATKNFFRLNYRKFLPEYDYDMIQASNKKKVFFEALLKEMDKLDDVITSMYQAFDIDEVPYEYLEYLASLIGYESEDKDLVKDYVFRDLVKNMVEVYKVKGSNYSFELFLTFLGFDVTIDEYWFDRRFYWKKAGAINEFTNEKNKYSSMFYLSPMCPEDYVPTSLSNKSVVFKNEIKGTMDLNKFNRYFYEGGFTDHFGNNVKLDGSNLLDIGWLLGYTKKDGKYYDDPYTYFKTNVVNFNFSSFKEDEGAAELTNDDIKIINRIFEFLLPIFIERQTVVAINDWMENVNPDESDNPDEFKCSFLKFQDKASRMYFINTDFQEVMNFDPIYNKTEKWNPNNYYAKNSVVIYDDSSIFKLYMTVEKGDVVVFEGKYYRYTKDEPKSCIEIPSTDPDFEEVLYGYPKYYKSNFEIETYNKYDYVSATEEDVSEAVLFEEGMTLTPDIVVVYDGEYYQYEGDESKIATETPDEDEDFSLLNAYYVSLVDNNSSTINNIDEWYNFVPYDFVLGITVRPQDVVYYNGEYYYYAGSISKQAIYNPDKDSEFFKITKKLYYKASPGEGNYVWSLINYDENKNWFSVFDRVKKEYGLDDKGALNKINKMLTSFSVTSKEITDFSKMNGKYLIFKFPQIQKDEVTKRGSVIKPVDLFEETEVEAEEILLINGYYYYCNQTGILNLDNWTNFATIINNNLAGTRKVPIFDKSLTITFDNTVVDFDTFYNKIEEKFNENLSDNPSDTSKLSDYYDLIKGENKFTISSKIDKEYNEEPYIEIIYDFVKIEEPQDELNFGIDKNNLYNIFPEYYTSPRYRDDFTVRIPNITYEAKIRGNYIFVNYPSARFATGIVPRREIMSSYFDSYSFDDASYTYMDKIFSEQIYPLLSYGFVFNDKKQKCYKDYYPSFTEYDIVNSDADSSVIFINMSNVTELPIKVGDKIDLILNYIDGSYEDNYEVLTSVELLGYNMIIIQQKFNELRNIVSGKIRVSKKPWLLKEYDVFARDYLISGKRIFEFDGTIRYDGEYNFNSERIGE